jgi:DNA invertase Pin-like site-specific DNA recombinase
MIESNTKVAFYCRANNNRGSKHLLTLQQQMLTDSAKNHEWEVAGIYSEVEVDVNDVMGKRPALTNMMNDAAKGKFNLVVVTTLDRLSRSPGELLNLIVNLGLIKVDVISLDEIIDTRKIGSRSCLEFLSELADAEKKRDSQLFKAIRTYDTKKQIKQKTNRKLKEH